jgi:hypothetical protein
MEIVGSEPAFDGQQFGNTGAYERLTAKAFGEVDPADPHNAIIQDLRLAPRNAHGMVEYVTNVEILKPADIARGTASCFSNSRTAATKPRSLSSTMASRGRPSSMP